MTISRMKLLSLKWSAEWAAAKPSNESTSVVYMIMVPPTDVLELIAEIERHRQVNAEGCKPESSIHPPDTYCADAASCRSLDKAEGCRPDLINSPHQGVAALREDIQRGNRIQIALALDLSAIAEALGITPDEQQGGAAESIAAIKKLQVRLAELEQRHD